MQNQKNFKKPPLPFNYFNYSMVSSLNSKKQYKIKIKREKWLEMTWNDLQKEMTIFEKI